MTFEEVYKYAKKVLGKRVYSKDKTAFLIDGTLGFGNRHNVWVRDLNTKEINIFARNVTFAGMHKMIEGLYDTTEAEQLELFSIGSKMEEKKQVIQNKLTQKSSGSFPPPPMSEDEYGNITLEEFERYYNIGYPA